MANNEFTYVAGTGKGRRFSIQFENTTIPASVVTRIEKKLKDKPEDKAAFIIYSEIARFPAFLEALDAAKLSYPEALKLMVASRPSKLKDRGVRASKTAKAATAFAKAICKRFKGEPAEMVENFIAIVSEPEFRLEATEVIAGFKASFGTNRAGFIKTSKREGNPGAQAALEKHRQDKKSHPAK